MQPDLQIAGQNQSSQLASMFPQLKQFAAQTAPPVVNPQPQQQVLGANTQAQVSPYQETGKLDPSNPWQDFINRAERVSKAEDFPPGVLLGQAAIESGRAKAAPGNNFFGLKGTGNAGRNMLATQEYGPNGYYTTASGFAAFKTPEDAMRAYINLIKKNYPQAYAQRQDPMAMLQAIRAGGYATSPTYVQSVSSTPEFKQFAGGTQ